MLKASAIMALPLLAIAAASAEQAKGYVYEDENGNGRRDRWERGVAGVSVSNGTDVARTNRWGQYWIELPEEAILFITKPADYDVPVNAQNLPQFYYIHYPAGTPNPGAFRYPVIKPTGPLPEYVDFALLPLGKRKHRKHDRFDAIAFADPQADSDEEIDFVREDVVAELVGTDARFGMVAGDVINDHLDLYPHHNDIMSKIGIPIWNVPGNHDMNFDALDDKYATETYKSIFGPTYFSFDYGEVHFIGLDNVRHTGRGRYFGEIGAAQLKWLENDLKHVPKHKLIVIYSHIPLKTDAIPGDAGINTADLKALFALLESFPHIYTFSGHDTSNSWQMYLTAEHGWFGPKPFHHQVLTEVRGGSWNGPRDERGVRSAITQDGTPNGYYVMSFEGNKYSARYKAASHGADYAMRLVLDPPLATAGEKYLHRGRLEAPTKVIANVFDGGDMNLVEVSFDGAAYTPMAQVRRVDPFMLHLFEKFRGTGDAYGRPEETEHIWEAQLPEGLAPGAHVARVRSKDMFGRETEASLVFVILP